MCKKAVLHPKQEHHNRSVRRAAAFVRGHLDEPLSLKRVARVAGFAPTYFSSIFAKTEKTTLARSFGGCVSSRQERCSTRRFSASNGLGSSAASERGPASITRFRSW